MNASAVPVPHNKATEEEEAGEEEQKIIKAARWRWEGEARTDGFSAGFPRWREEDHLLRTEEPAPEGALRSSPPAGSHPDWLGPPTAHVEERLIASMGGGRKTKGFREPLQQMMEWTINQNRQLNQKSSKKIGLGDVM